MLNSNNNSNKGEGVSFMSDLSRKEPSPPHVPVSRLTAAVEEHRKMGSLSGYHSLEPLGGSSGIE
jgi:hypothetical protein